MTHCQYFRGTWVYPIQLTIFIVLFFSIVQLSINYVFFIIPGTVCSEEETSPLKWTKGVFTASPNCLFILTTAASELKVTLIILVCGLGRGHTACYGQADLIKWDTDIAVNGILTNTSTVNQNFLCEWKEQLLVQGSFHLWKDFFLWDKCSFHPWRKFSFEEGAPGSWRASWNAARYLFIEVEYVY